MFTGRPVRRYAQLSEQLWMGGQFRFSQLGFLQDLGVTGVVTMRSRNKFEKEVLPDELELLHLPTADRHAPTLEALERGIEFVERQLEKNGAVYIHCRQGEGRGPTMGAAYLIHTGQSVDEAISTIRDTRPFLIITGEQRRQLERFAQTVA
jgi:dual specificity MAP kinase phosphatase